MRFRSGGVDGQEDQRRLSGHTGGGGSAHSGGDVLVEFRGLRSALLALYAARIEATRRYLPRDQVAGAVQALIDQQRAEMRALAERKRAALRARQEWREAERFSERLVVQAKQKHDFGSRSAEPS